MNEFVPSIQTERCLREVFCERFKCPAGEFENRLFWLCLRHWQRPLVRMLFLFRREYFKADFDLIVRLGRSTSARELKYELESYRHYHPPAGFLRKKMKIRISGKRLLKLSSKWFAREATQQLNKAKRASRTLPGA